MKCAGNNLKVFREVWFLIKEPSKVASKKKMEAIVMRQLKDFAKVIIAILFLYAQVGTAAVGNFNAKVERILTDDVLFGGCMALLSTSGSNATSGAINCPQRWVALDCDNSVLTNGSKAKAARKYSAAQLALVTDSWVTVYLTDTPKASSNYCVAIRIDNFAPGLTP